VHCPLMNGECFREDCSWWLEEKAGCSVKVIAQALDQLEEQGVDVYRKE